MGKMDKYMSKITELESKKLTEKDPSKRNKILVQIEDLHKDLEEQRVQLGKYEEIQMDSIFDIHTHRESNISNPSFTLPQKKITKLANRDMDFIEIKEDMLEGDSEDKKTDDIKEEVAGTQKLTT